MAKRLLLHQSTGRPPRQCGELVLVHYEYELTTGDRYGNVEAITGRDGLVREAQVFFGGRVGARA